MSDTAEPITREEREWIKDDTLPNRFPEEVHALFAYEAALSASEAREKRLQAELDALNDDGALHTAYLSGQQDAKERIAELEAREKRLQERIDLAGKLLSDAFAEKESLLNNDYLFAAFSHVVPTPK